MTRHDFITLSSALRAVENYAHDRNMAVMHERCCRAIADAIAHEIPKFDRARFLKDCGVTL